ncbi:hypothetical protein [Microbulbifer pacificus]|uniref:hypothetical protein n=1 Tax=Microbulbifer pacificus TaxID=407164 RepID=UPI001F2CA2C7|nr:hypothetical protein [Microbulbifer pacificus]
MKYLSERWLCVGAGALLGMWTPLASLAIAEPHSGVPVSPATLLNAWWIDGSEGLDISGLSFCDGELLAVADKVSEQIFQLSPESDRDSVALKTKAGFTRPSLPDDQPVPLKARALHVASPSLSMDFEGITCDADGIYLLSERYNRIARLNSIESRGEWLPVRWSESAKTRGFLRVFNAESEGVAKIGDDFWVALERDPRGLLKLHAGDQEGRDFRVVPEVKGLDFRGRSEDIAGLAAYDGALFTLERNAFAVCRRNVESLQAEWCIHYHDVEEGSEFVYLDTRFGKGEGLAVNERGIFVVLDNNGIGRAAAPEDTRGLLLHLAFPEAEMEGGNRI